MNGLKEKKALIEWEKELDVWLVDILMAEHFLMYTKFEAFDKIVVNNFKRNWSTKENEIYKKYKSDQNINNLVEDTSKRKFMWIMDTDYQDSEELSIEKPLIEWEKEVGKSGLYVETISESEQKVEESEKMISEIRLSNNDDLVKPVLSDTHHVKKQRSKKSGFSIVSKKKPKNRIKMKKKYV